MDFDWHDEKSEECRRERGFGFDFAALIFASPVFERVDNRRDYGEVRVQALGFIEAAPYVVVYTDRLAEDGEPVRWIISARRAHRKEVRRWLARS